MIVVPTIRRTETNTDTFSERFIFRLSTLKSAIQSKPYRIGLTASLGTKEMITVSRIAVPKKMISFMRTMKSL